MKLELVLIVILIANCTFSIADRFFIKKIRLFDSLEHDEARRQLENSETKARSSSVPEIKCGYNSCTVSKANMLNVHIVPHTHDDVGWLKTVDQYYYGSKSLIQKAGVQYILDSVVQELIKDSKKRFIYVESAFFFKWWGEQTEEVRGQVQTLVSEGRLEFIGGGWSMNDEAATHYNSIVDQFTWGLRRLNDTFGECGRPRVGWQIDPFGHSREQASLFAQMNYDGLFLGRIDYQDKGHRMTTKTPEMIWHGSQSLGESADLFTGVLYNTYSPPPGFCFDILCADEPIIDDPESPDYNVPERVDEFFQYIYQQSNYYRSNNLIVTMGGDFTYMDANAYYVNAFFEYIESVSLSYRSSNLLITMGDDFNYQDARAWFKNLDKYANDRQKNGSDINLFYSTPSCYLKALNDAKLTWPEKFDDFFPYASDPHAFWTGYFSSRPTIKRFERIGNQFLQICKQLTSFAPTFDEKFDERLAALREAMGVMQHHDAITGTEKQKVAFDYARILDGALNECSSNTHIALNQLSTRTSQKNDAEASKLPATELPFSFTSCKFLNISQCEISETSNKFIVTVYNPLAHSVFEYVRVPVRDGNYLVQDYRNVEILHQLNPTPSTIRNLEFRKNNATQELVFLASEIPPMGYKSFFITRLNDHTYDTKLEFEAEGIVSISNKYLNLTFNDRGLLETITADGVSSKMTQYFVYYEAASGNNMEFLNRSSGAYIFRPNNTEKIVAKSATLSVVRGIHVEEVRQTFNDWCSQVVRLYREENYVEFEWLVGPIPVDDKVGKEIVSRFYSLIENNGTFYTDSNGREMLRRKRNNRETWDLRLEEKIAGNYYPVTNRIALEDDNNRLSILTDRAQGGTSLFDGSLELMVHRRLLHDDAFGVSEALNEPGYGKGLVARGKHHMVFGKVSEKTPTIQARERFLQNQKQLSSWLFFSDASKIDYLNWTSSYSNIFSAITLSLPINIHVLTFEPWRRDIVNGDSYLVRFEHLLEKDEDLEYSKPVKFNLEDVFRNLNIWTIRETTLSANQWISDAKRMKFVSDPKDLHFDNINQRYTFAIPKDYDDKNEIKKDERRFGIDFEVELQPMQIRTFVIQLAPKF